MDLLVAPYKLVEHASIEHSFRSPALEELVIVVLETIPVSPELLQTALVDVA
jgi:hypothetical protein